MDHLKEIKKWKAIALLSILSTIVFAALCFQEYTSGKLLEAQKNNFIKWSGEGNLDLVKKAIDNGVHPYQRGERGYTPLHEAAEKGHARVVGALIYKWYDDLDKGINATNFNGETALHLAKGVDTVEELIKFNADLNRQDIEGNTPLMAFILNGKKEEASSIIIAGAHVLTRNKDGKTANDLCLEKYGMPIWEYLIEGNIPKERLMDADNSEGKFGSK